MFLNVYEVEAVLGEGGFGQVYRVRCKVTKESLAVKRAKFTDPGARLLFLKELRNWMGMPEHPNLLACRFFRTLDDEVLVFSECMSDGSLADWIAKRRLYEGAPTEALAAVLSFAIQSAWGLHTGHCFGLVHCDVKPANFMISDHVLKVGDFGLSSGEVRADQDAMDYLLQDVPGDDQALAKLVLRSSMTSANPLALTPAYASPEQAAGRGLSHKTDVFSWAVSVLEMYLGECTWMAGAAATTVLDESLFEANPKLPPMPAGLRGVLVRALHSDPAERPLSLKQVADELCVTYQKETRVPFPRPFQKVDQEDQPYQRITVNGTTWADPRQILELLAGILKLDPKSLIDQFPYIRGPRSAQAADDMIVYSEAQRLCEEAMARGRTGLEPTLAINVFNQIAPLRRSMNDLVGALEAYESSVKLLRQLAKQDPATFGFFLAYTITGIGTILRALDQHREAAERYREAADGYKRVFEATRKQNVFDSYLDNLKNIARALADAGDAAGSARAMAEFQAASGLGQRNRVDAAYDMIDRARPLIETDPAVAAELLTQAIVNLQEHLDQGRTDVVAHLAKAFGLRSLLFRMANDSARALACAGRGLDLMEQAVLKNGQSDLANILAGMYGMQAGALRAAGQETEALELFSRGIAAIETLFVKLGQHELGVRVLLLKAKRVEMLVELGKHDDARREAHAIWGDLQRSPLVNVPDFKPLMQTIEGLARSR